MTITPEHVDQDDHAVYTHVYELSSDVIDHIGTLVFHIDDQYEWEYCGDVLTSDETEQVVFSIQNAKV